MGAPKIYRWDDDSAPVASGIATSLVDILTACLVDGYGTKVAAGWTREYVNVEGTKAVFRNSTTTGTGMFLRVENDGGTYLYTNYVDAYESMTDIDTGTGKFNSLNVFISTSNANNTTPRPWVLIADDRCFYFIFWSTGDASTGPTAQEFVGQACFFGDIISEHDSDPYACGLIASAYAYYGSYLTTLIGSANASTNNYRWIARNVAGDNASTFLNLIYNGGPSNSGGMGTGISRTQGAEFFARPYVSDGPAYSFRGWMPGLWYPCHMVADFDNFEELSLGGHDFMIFHTYNYTQHSFFALDLSENFRP